jgi:hypothetical protein
MIEDGIIRRNPMRKINRLAVLLLGFALVLAAGQEIKDVFGVPVYPGAKLDEATTKFLADSMGFDGKAFRTPDPLAKVAEFYKAQGLTEVMVSQEGAMFRKGDDVDITLQNPWQNMLTGNLEKDTLISIVKHD